MTWFQIQQSRSMIPTRRDIGEKTEPLFGRRDDLPTTDTLKGQRISYLKYFHDRSNPKFIYYLRSRDGKPVLSALYLAPSLTDIYSGITPSAGRGYDNVSASSH